MKATLIILSLLSGIFSANAQSDTTSIPKTLKRITDPMPAGYTFVYHKTERDSLIHKAKNSRIIGASMLVVGSGLAIGGLILYGENMELDMPGWGDGYDNATKDKMANNRIIAGLLMLAGAVIDLASIPVLKKANRFAKEAKRITLAISNQQVPQYMAGARKITVNQPSFTLTIPLGQ